MTIQKGFAERLMKLGFIRLQFERSLKFLDGAIKFLPERVTLSSQLVGTPGVWKGLFQFRVTLRSELAIGESQPIARFLIFLGDTPHSRNANCAFPSTNRSASDKCF